MENRITRPAGIIPEEAMPPLRGSESQNRVRSREEEYEEPEQGNEEESGATSLRPKGIPTREVNRYIGYVVFMVAIGMVYIWSSHLAEKQVRKEEKLMGELRDMKAEYKTFYARLSSGTRKSEIAKKVEPFGLKIPDAPPYKIIPKR